MFPIFAAHAAPTAILMVNAGLAHGESIGSYHGDLLYFPQNLVGRFPAAKPQCPFWPLAEFGRTIFEVSLATG